MGPIAARAYLEIARTLVQRAEALVVDGIRDARAADDEHRRTALELEALDRRAARTAAMLRGPIPCRCGRHIRRPFFFYQGRDLVDVWCWATWNRTDPVDWPYMVKMPMCCEEVEDDQQTAR